jgi:hypothetical protein
MPRARHRHVIVDGRLQLARPPGLYKKRDAVWSARHEVDIYEALPVGIRRQDTSEWLDEKDASVLVEVDHVLELQLLNVALPQTPAVSDSLGVFEWFADYASATPQLNVTSKNLNRSKGGVVKGWLALADTDDEKKEGAMTFENLREWLGAKQAAGELVARNVTREMSNALKEAIRAFNADENAKGVTDERRDDVVVKLWRWKDEHLQPSNLM